MFSQLQKILLQDEIETISVVNPTIYEQNIKNFQKILEQNHLKYAIHSVLKVNHSNALLKTALQNGLRADISSLGELNQVLAMGFVGENITANGPKNKKFLEKCIDENVLIVVDNEEEIDNIEKFCDEKNKKIEILVRLSGFDIDPNSRFGIRKNHWEKIAEKLGKSKNIITKGIHFQIGSHDLEHRKQIFWESIDFYKLLLKQKIIAKIINIGGSFGAYYKNDLTFHCSTCARFSLGEKLYPQSTTASTDFLEKFLTDISYRGTNIRDFIRENGLELWLEPGRALTTNNVGFVATSILGLREDCAILNTNSFGLGMREEELPTNPFLAEYWHEPLPKNHENSYWLLGNLCLESDIIYSRSIPFHRAVKADDIIIFPDMTAYHMDFYETESILHPKKKRFFVDENGILQEDI